MVNQDLIEAVSLLRRVLKFVGGSKMVVMWGRRNGRTKTAQEFTQLMLDIEEFLDEEVQDGR